MENSSNCPLKAWLTKIRQHRQKTRLFSPHSLHNTGAGGVPGVDIGCARLFSYETFRI